MIYTIEEFVDDENRRVTKLQATEYTSSSSSFEERYTGRVVMGIRTPQGVLEREITFPIEASNVVEAFANFEKCKEENAPKEAEKIIRQLKEHMKELHEQQQKKIVVPNPNQPIRFKG